MRRVFGTPVLISLLLVQCAFASSSVVGLWADGPELVMNITKHDFGEVFAGEELEQIFLFRNAGTKQLELSQKSALSGSAIVRRSPVTAALVRSGDRVSDSWERGRPGRLSATGTMRPGRPRSQGFVRTVAATRAAPS